MYFCISCNIADTQTTFSSPQSAFQYILETVEWLLTGLENYTIQDREAPMFKPTKKTTGYCNSPLLYTVALTGGLVYVQVMSKILMWFTEKALTPATGSDSMNEIAHSMGES